MTAMAVERITEAREGLRERGLLERGAGGEFRSEAEATA